MASQDNPLKLSNSYKSPIMAAYQAKIRQQNQFLNLIRATLPASLAEHLLSCVISAKKCLLYTDTEEWATQLRFYLPIILNAIHASNLATVDFIQVRLISLPEAAHVSHKINLPSKQNIELMRDNLQTIADDELKLALLRLSQTLDRLS